MSGMDSSIRRMAENTVLDTTIREAVDGLVGEDPPQ